MDTTINPTEDFPDIDRYDLGEKGLTKRHSLFFLRVRKGEN